MKISSDATIGKLAYESLMQGNRDLELNLEPEQEKHLSHVESEGILISNRKLIFSSLEVKNQIIAEYIFKKNKKTIPTPEDWFSIAHDVWVKEIQNHQGCSDKSAGRLLALVHEDEDIFLLALNALSTSDDYTKTRVLSHALPHLKEITAKNIIQLFSSKEQQQNPSSLYGILNELQQLLETLPDTCREIHQGYVGLSSGGLYTTTLLALAKTDSSGAFNLILSDINNTNNLVKQSALWTIGRLYQGGFLTEDESSKYNEILIHHSCNSDKDTQETAISSMATLLTTTDVFDEKIFELKNNQFALAKVASELWLGNSKGSFSKKRLKNLVSLLSGISTENHEGVDNFNHVLQFLMKNDCNQELVITVFSDWIVAQTSENEGKEETEVRQFESLFYEIANRKDLLAQVITNWLLSEDRKLAIACKTFLSILNISGFKDPKFDTFILDDLELLDIKLLIRRMLGFIVDEHHLISLSMSLLESKNAPKRMFGIVHSLLTDEIGRDFPSSVVDTIKAAKDAESRDNWIGFYVGIIEVIEFPLDEFDKLPRLNELKPSYKLQNIFAFARSKAINDAIDESRDDGSSIASLFTEIPIKAGKGWLNYRDGEFSEPAFMQEHSHSITIPKRDTLDEVGSKIRRFRYRYAKRGEE